MANLGLPLRLRSRAVWAAATVVCLGSAPILLSGCGTTRSAAAYCQVFYGEGSKLRATYSSADANDPLQALGTILSAPSQLASFLGQLEAVAPGTIEPAVATLQQAFQEEANEEGDAATDPIGALFGGLVAGLSSQQAAQEVTQWTFRHCGAPPGSSSQSTTTS